LENWTTIIIYITSFTIIALASKEIGNFFNKFKFPMISGFLFTGVIAGPYGLGLIENNSIENLRFIDEIALAIIAFAAGNELYIKELRAHLKSIKWITAGQILFTFPISALAIFFLADMIPFMQSLPILIRVAIALMGGAILVANSPSSTIAVVNELRARGPFTKTVLGVTMIVDVIVIILFGVNSSIADALITNLPFNLGFVLLILVELLTSFGLAYILFRILQAVLSINIPQHYKAAAVLLLGYGVFMLSGFIRETTHNRLPFEFLVEPLLICMIAGFLLSSFSNYRDDFSLILHQISPTIYIFFFTLTGASLGLDILIQVWPIALALFLVRLVGVFLGSFSGGLIAKDPKEHNRLGWMAYVTQAGVGLGLAKEVAVEFPSWGDAFATMVISVIVLNQVVGPPILKWVINRVGESHSRAKPMDFDGMRDVFIFGLKAQAVTLARQLLRHDWQVKLVCTDADCESEPIAPDIDIHILNDITLESLRNLGAEHADALVSFLPNDKSYEVCEMFYEHFGTETMVVRLKDRTDFDRFHDLGVLVVEPQTAVVSLLEHFVRSPIGTALLLGMGDGQEMIELEVRNPDIVEISLRDLRLPIDVLVLSVHRDGKTLVSRGFTEFMLGDKISLVGPMEKLEQVKLRFDA